MNDKKVDKKQMMSEYFRGLAKKSHASVKSKFGSDFYKVIGSRGGKKKADNRRKEQLKKDAEKLSP